MSAAEKRVRAYFKNSEVGYMPWVTTGEGTFALTKKDVLYLAGERRRVAREISQAVGEKLHGTKYARIVAEICKELGDK